MTKKHFIALADALRHVWPAMTLDAQKAILDFCRAQNPRFMESRWLDYVTGQAGPNGGQKS